MKNKKQTALEAAQEIIQLEAKKAVDNCVAELNELQKKEAEILAKYDCVKNFTGRFVNNQLEHGIVITKK